MDGEEKRSGAPPELSQAIDQLLANPQLISMVASALGGASAPATPPEETAQAAPATDTQTTEPSAPSVPPAGADPAALMTSLAPLLSGLSGKGGGDKQRDDNRTCLLRALRPYVSAGRQEAIDYMIRFAQITDLLKHMV